MMVRTEPAYRPSPRHLALFAGTLFAIGLGIFAAASKAQDSPPMLDFLARVQSHANAMRAENLIEAISRPGAIKRAPATTVTRAVMKAAGRKSAAGSLQL